jgi:hypothetical protein
LSSLKGVISSRAEWQHEQPMTLIRKGIAFARTAIALFFGPTGHPALDASDLDSYLFDRETRMNEAWGRSAAVRTGSDRIRPVSEPLMMSRPKQRGIRPSSSAPTMEDVNA